MKVVLLSNINFNPVARMLTDECDVFETEEYGNEIGILLNKQSSFYTFNPGFVFIIEDIIELIALLFCARIDAVWGKGLKLDIESIWEKRLEIRTTIMFSEDKEGLAYKNLQCVILQI